MAQETINAISSHLINCVPGVNVTCFSKKKRKKFFDFDDEQTGSPMEGTKGDGWYQRGTQLIASFD